MEELTVNSPDFIEELVITNSGVDFLGLRQNNLDMMHGLLPGINNVTSKIRPYSVAAWIFWKINQYLIDNQHDKSALQRSNEFQERMESLFVWGHQNHYLHGLPGINSLPPEPIDGQHPLDFASWKRTKSSTSLMAPVQYGPSSKQNGLGFLEQMSRALIVPTEQGAQLAKALDESLKQHTNSSLEQFFTQNTASKATADALFQGWRADQPTQKEQKLFLASFYRPGFRDDKDLGRRSGTIDWILHCLEQSQAPLGIEEIRWSMAFAIDPATSKTFAVPEDLEVIRLRWLVLMIRQAQRLALETLLTWVEKQLEKGALPQERLGEIILEELDDVGYAPDQTAAMWFEDMFLSNALESYFTKGDSEENDIFSLMEEIIEANEKEGCASLDLPITLLLHCLFLSEQLSDQPEAKKLLHQGSINRIPLGFFFQWWQNTQNRTGGAWVMEIIYQFVLAQHYQVALGRYDGSGTVQRLRIIQEEEGLTSLSPTLFRPYVSADRLWVCLSLLVDAGVLSVQEGVYNIQK